MVAVVVGVYDFSVFLSCDYLGGGSKISEGDLSGGTGDSCLPMQFRSKEEAWRQSPPKDGDLL